jgi:hypothetical protein
MIQMRGHRDIVDFVVGDTVKLGLEGEGGGGSAGIDGRGVARGGRMWIRWTKVGVVDGEGALEC